MIINIRGTSGSGKTHLVKEVMKHYVTEPQFTLNRKRPLWYRCIARKPWHALAVVGHYEIACGGCDTIAGNDIIYNLIKSLSSEYLHVIYEGLLISAETARCIALKDGGYPLLVVGLTTPLEQCLSSVNSRRHAKNPDKPDVNPKNTTSKFRGVQTSMTKLQAAGVDAVWLDRDAALARVLMELAQ